MTRDSATPGLATPATARGPATLAAARGTWALVPLRGLEDAKTRLGGELDAEERHELVIEMASRTLAAARDARTISGTVLVTADPAAADLAHTFGARAIVQLLPGLNAALREARGIAIEAGAAAVLIIPIDLPAVSAEALDALVTAAGAAAAGATAGSDGVTAGPDGRLDAGRPVVLAVPDRHGRGTNALYLSPPGVIEPLFGEASFAAHRVAAHAAGVRFVMVEGPLTLDVDTAADLLVAETSGSRPTGGGTGNAA